jgi:hypothetical protein
VITRIIEIAGVGFRFLADARAAALVERRYGAFLVAATTDATDVELRLGPADPDARGDVPVDVARHGDRIALRADTLSAEVHADLRRARVEAPLGDRAVDAVVRFVLAARLLARGGLLVHASAVRVDGRAWLFVGPSGAGKTTVAAALRGDVLCDEAVAVLPAPGSAVAHATPYWRARPASAPVAGLAFLGRRSGGEPPAWRPLPAARAVSRLLAACGPHLPDAVPDTLRAAIPLVRSLSCAEAAMSNVDQIRTWLQPQLERTATLTAAAS